MRLTIDTKTKRIYLIDDISLSELKKFMKKTFADEYKKYVISSYYAWTYSPYAPTVTTFNTQEVSTDTITANQADLKHYTIDTDTTDDSKS